jgi:acyl-CoA thioester hydrolase
MIKYTRKDVIFVKSISIINPRYQETDAMGVIHHSVYPVWYEVGRIDYLDETELPYKKINELGYHLALIDLQVSYKKPAHFGDTLELYTWIANVTRTKVTICYEIYNQKEELINTGSTTHVFVDNDLKLVNMSKANPKIYQLFEDSIEKQG